ncbi:organic solvent tolerance protein [Candidatus Pelagibacter sp.]|nr:organic solvent tolerance protein [Candidatus Pelagibacter sp.]
MINKLLYILLILILNIMTSFSTYAAEIFNFDVTEIEIIEEGNKFLGKNGGTATSDNGTVIKANNFEYDKLKNILIAIGDVEINDKKENIIITSQKVTYFKNKEFIFSEGQSQAINEGIIIDADNFEYNKINNIINANGNVKIDNKSENYLIYSNNATYFKNEELFLTKGQSQAINEGIIIDADNFEYNKINNIINANGNVKITDPINDYLILANDATYYKNQEKIITNGDTEAFIQSRYIIKSKDITYLHNEKILSSQEKSKIKDQNSQVYFAEKFKYLINEEIIKGENFLIITNYNLPKSDKFFLENGIINLKDKTFVAKDTKIKIHKDIFDNTENDPRIEGVSSKGDENITIINKGVFTSCKKNDTCPPWSIQSEIIKHDKIKKTLNYENAILKIYDFPVLYFPKFFHPDPSVKRQSGLLKPAINSSNVLGSSLTLPYFKVISENKDLTFTPTWFDSDTLMTTVEYRQENKDSSLIADFNFVNGYKSPTTKKKNSLSHLFLNFNLDLNLEKFTSSTFNMEIEKVSNDSYLNVFDQYITKSNLRPSNFNKLTNNINLSLDHENYNFQSGVQSFEDLRTKKQSDRYQYVLPYYNFDKNISQNYFNGNFSFNSNGNNRLNNTNKLETSVINNLTYNSLDIISNLGIKSNFGVNFKNLNSIGKKSTKYKSSMQSELVSLYNIDVSLPLIKESTISKNLLTPKLSLRFNPSDMKNYTTTVRTIDANNAWAINRLGLSDTYESGRSLTLGLNYSNEKKDKLDQINNYFEMKLATILRDKEEKFIPNNSTINRKNSNLFGSVTNKFSENIEIGYNFSLDNDLNTLEYNNIDTTISLNNIVTKFNFIEENGERGNSNIVGGSIAYSLDDKNFFSFETRKNRKLNLTEFYDLVYEYKNDCLTAGIKYKKTYYSDGDLRPSENLLFTVTLFPITTYEHDAGDLLEN